MTSSEVIRFNDLSDFSLLFTDYLQFDPRLAPYFAGDFRKTDTFERVAHNTLQIARDRETLADVLIEQNARWGIDDPTRENIERLRQNDSVTVVTGQQLGLFLSPLYIPYKTLTAISLARKMEDELNRPVIPVFWLAGEDHDFEEVASFRLIDDTDLVKLTYEHDGAEAGKGPVGRLELSPHINTLIDRVASILPQSENTGELLDELRTQFKPGRSFTDAFASFLRRLFRGTGLVIVNSDDVRLKRLCQPLFQKELATSVDLAERMNRATQDLTKYYHAQVQLRPTNLFLMDDEARQPIDVEGKEFVLRDGSRRFDLPAVRDLVETSPERLSPNVIMRPIVQDVLFPTIAYVGGPGEIAYFAQCKPAYEWADLPMPVIFPRASMTLIEPAIDKILKRYQWDLPALRSNPEHLFRDYVIQTMPFDIKQLVADSEAQIDQAVAILNEAAISLNGSLQKTAGSTRTALKKDLNRFVDRIVRAQKRSHDSDRQRIFKAHTHLLPAGKLQERTLSPLHFLNRYGLDFFRSLMRDVSLDTTQHQAIRL